MNATPAFKDRESEFLLHVPIGTKVRASWGAMFAEDRGEVVGANNGQGHLIRWEASENIEGESRYGIRATRSPNGSSIGVWVDKV